MELNIGESLKQHREQRNLTITQLAKQTGISRQNLTRWEENLVVPNALFCVKLAQFYDISIDELLGIKL